jgi:hypothetical protein
MLRLETGKKRAVKESSTVVVQFAFLPVAKLSGVPE